MATDKLLKFYKGGSQPSEVGSIWFNNGLLSVVGKNGLEYFSGLQDATFENNKLTIVKADGTTKVELDFSDVASAGEVKTVLSTLRDSINELSNTVESNRQTAATGVEEAKTAAANALTDAKKYTDEEIVKVNTVIGKKAEGENAATGLYAEIAAGDVAVAQQVTTLGQTVSSQGEQIDDIKESIKSITGEAGSIAEQITAALEGLTNAPKGDGTYVDVTVNQSNGKVTAVAVDETALSEKFGDIEDAIEAAEGAAAEGDEAIMKVIGGSYSESATVDAAIKAAAQAAADAQADIDAFLSATEVGDEVIDTLKEIQDWIANDETGTTALVNRVGALEGKVDVAKVSEAIAAAKAEVVGTLGEGDAATVAAINDELDAIDGEIAGLKGLVGTTSVASQITAVTNPISNRVTAVENKLTDVEATVGAEIAEALAAYSTTEQMNTALAGKVDNGTLTAYQSEVSAALEGKATVDAVEKNAEDIEAIQTQLANGLFWQTF